MAEDFRVIAILRAKPGQEDAVRDAALACVAPTQAEPGNTMYLLHRDTQDPALFVFIEHWKTRQALDEHMQSAHLKALAAAMEGKLAGPPSIHVLAEVAP